MHKKYIDKGDYYPYYTLSEYSYYDELPVEISPELLERYQDVMGKFIDMQEEFDKLFSR